MHQLTEKLIDTEFANRIVRESDLALLFGRSPASRYGMVNKALKRGELIRLCRGVYCLADKYRTSKLSRHYIAGQIVRPSFISFESSLAFHGWIPERVETIDSVVTNGRTRGFETDLGYYQYIRLPTEPFNGFGGVVHRDEQGQPFLIASPLRALADLIYRTKQTEITMRYLTDGLRIDSADLSLLKASDFASVAPVYRFNYVRRFLAFLQKELGVQ